MSAVIRMIMSASVGTHGTSSSTSRLTKRRSQPGLSLSVVRKDFGGFISQVPGGSAFFVRPHYTFMKTLPFILLFALVGCSRSSSPSIKMGGELHEWIPVGTTLQAARQIMEQHQYVCAVESYDDVKAITNKMSAYDLDAVQWTQVYMQDSKNEAVTNISVLVCDWTDTKDRYNHRNAGWLIINNKTYQLLTWGCNK